MSPHKKTARFREKSFAYLPVHHACLLIATACSPTAQHGRSESNASVDIARNSDPAPTSEPQLEENAGFDVNAEVRLPGSPTAAALALAEPADLIAFTQQRLSEPDRGASSAGRLRWLQAQAHRKMGDDAAAVPLLEAIAQSDHPLSPVAALELARLLQQGDPGRAIEASRRAAGEAWSGKPEATLLWGMLSDDREPGGEAVRKLASLLADTAPQGIRGHAAVLLAKLWTETPSPDGGDGAQILDALREARQHGSATLREAANAELVRLRPAEQLPAATTPGPAERRLLDAEALFRRNRYQQVREKLRRLRRRRHFRTAVACEGGYLLGKALLRLRERSDGAELLERVAESCPDTDMKARALYNAAQARVRLGQTNEAITLYQRLEEVAPTNSLADDARYKAALAAREAGEAAQFTALLASLPETYPEGDMRRRARFALAWNALKTAGETEADERESALRTALGHLEASFNDRESTRSDLVGREAYWRGRVQQELGDTPAAHQTWRGITDAQPVSYYGWLAAEQIATADPAQRAAFASQCAQPMTASLISDPAPLSQPAFQRVLELLRVRERSTARKELQHWRQHVAQVEPNAAWFEIALLRAAGDHVAANRLLRRKIPALHRTAPWGEHHNRWRIAYPKAFASHVQRSASETGVAPELIWAVMRSESVFDSRAESPAGAYGLMQLILPTARRFAESGERISRRVLFVPETNVRLGSRFLGYLSGRLSEQRYAIPAAYNAGEGAARRWLRERSDTPVDNWIEEIPYDETRRYSRRVLSSFAVYRCLDGKSVLWLGTQDS